MIGLNKKHIQKEELLLNDFTKNMAQELYSIKTKLMIYCVKNYNKQLMTC